MTNTNILPRLLRLALETPDDPNVLRRLTAELIRLGHDAPPTPTAEQIERAARGIAAALFEGVPPDEWRAGGQGAVAFFEGADGETLGNITINYTKPSRDGSPLFVIALTPPHILPPRGSTTLPRFCTFPINATFEAREALRQLRLAIDRNACEDEINYPGPTVPINYRGHALPESARTRAWRLLYMAREQSPFNLMTRCPRCNGMRPTEDLTAERPTCADCRGGFHVSQEDGGVTVNNYGTATPPALALAVANRHFDLTRPGASWSAAANPNLIDDILRQARTLQAEGDRINGGGHIPGADSDEALGAAWRTDREATLQTFGHLPQFRAMHETPTLTPAQEAMQALIEQRVREVNEETERRLERELHQARAALLQGDVTAADLIAPGRDILRLSSPPYRPRPLDESDE